MSFAFIYLSIQKRGIGNRKDAQSGKQTSKLTMRKTEGTPSVKTNNICKYLQVPAKVMGDQLDREMKARRCFRGGRGMIFIFTYFL